MYIFIVVVHVLSLGSSLAPHDIIRLRDLSQDTEIPNTQMDSMTLRKRETQGKHKVSHIYPHKLQVLKEIRIIPRQHARKTISKMGPGFPWPGSYHARAGNGPLGPQAPKYVS